MAIRIKNYISGPITNNKNYINDFSNAEKKLTDAGYTVISPIKNEGFAYKDYIDMDLEELSKCNAIVMLEGWSVSKGSILEYVYARTNNYKIIYETNNSFLEGAELRLTLTSVYGLENPLFLDIITKNEWIEEFAEGDEIFDKYMMQE